MRRVVIGITGVGVAIAISWWLVVQGIMPHFQK